MTLYIIFKNMNTIFFLLVPYPLPDVVNHVCDDNFAVTRTSKYSIELLPQVLQPERPSSKAFPSTDLFSDNKMQKPTCLKCQNFVFSSETWLTYL